MARCCTRGSKASWIALIAGIAAGFAALAGAYAATTEPSPTVVPLVQPTDADRMPEVAAEDLAAIDALITELYASISGPVGQKRDRERMGAVFAEGASLAAMQPASREFEAFNLSRMTPDEYADRNIALLEELGFTESEIGRTLEIYGTIAHAFSAYEGHFTNNEGNPQSVKGINSIQLVKVNGEWKVYTILWDQQWPEGRNPVPERYISKSNTDGKLVKAGVCPHCGKYVPMEDGKLPEVCPICQENTGE